jgi:hypothetical protein
LSIFANSFSVFRESRFPFSTIQSKIIEKLQLVFENNALFFWNEFDGKSVGVLFRPGFLQNTEFNIMRSQFCCKVDGKEKVQSKNNRKEERVFQEPNFDEIICEILEISNHLLTLVTRKC